MTQRRPVATFFALTLLVSFALGAAVTASAHGRLGVSIPAEVSGLLIVGPAAVALVLVHRETGRAGMSHLLSGLTAWRVPVRWYAVALCAPAGINSAALVIHGALGGTVPRVPGAPAPEQQAVPLAVLPLLLLLLSAGEEIGWRGYALPKLQVRHSALASSLVIGLVWAVWHLPLTWPPDSTQGQLPFAWYLVGTTAMAVLFTWLANSTHGSLLLVTIFHASIQAAAFLVPVWPEATGDLRAYHLSVVITMLLAVSVVLFAGPRDLTRQRAADAGVRTTPRTDGSQR